MSMENVTYAGASSTFEPSGAIWGDCPLANLQLKSTMDRIGYFRRFDFSRFRSSTDVNASSAHWVDGLAAYGTTTAPVTAIDAVGGGITIGSSGDNGGVAIQDMQFPVQIDRSTKALWFEARIKSSTITDTKHDIFLGLMETAAISTSIPITTAGALSDNNLVGFFRRETALTGALVDSVYKANGVTAVTVQAGIATLVADTYVKLGFKYIPNSDPQGPWRLVFYVNGVRQTTSYLIPTAQGTDFPNDVRMGFIFAIMNATGSTPGTSSIQWAQLAQLL